MSLDLFSLPKERLLYRYKGLQGVGISRLESVYNRYKNRYFDDLYDNGIINPFQYGEAQEWFGFARSDMEFGRWWEREWQESLPLAKGGSDFHIYDIGEDIELFSLSELYVLSNGKVGVSDVQFLFDLQRNKKEDQIASSFPGLAGAVFSGRFEHGAIRVAFQPRITLKAVAAFPDFVSNMRADLKVFYFDKGIRTAGITVSVRANPAAKDYLASISFEFFRW